MLLTPLEVALGCSRASLSAVFSLATVCFTAGTSLGPILTKRLPPSGLILTTAAVTGSSLLLASLLGRVPARVGLWLLTAGWAGGFGTMSGMAYLCNAKISNSRYFAGNNGLATGLLVSGRAMGAPLATPIVRAALSTGGAVGALRALAGGVSLLLLPVAFVLRRLTWADLAKGSAKGSAPRSAGGESEPAPPPPVGRVTLAKLWLTLLCGSAPGLLCHGHAAAILTAASAAGGASAAALGPVGVSAMATGSLVGRMGGGVLIDRISARRCLVRLPLLTAATLAGPLALPGSTLLTVAALAGCGLTYGLNAVALPVLVARLYGSEAFPAMYGKVFTAWGTAGVLTPWAAGRLYDLTGGYTASLVASAVAALAAAAAAASLPSSCDDTPEGCEV